MITTSTPDNNNFLLLKEFNNRKDIAFSKVYDLYYKEFHYYAHSLYKNTAIEAADVVHDVFLHIWETKSLKFESSKSLKSYIYITIKNKFISYIRHLNVKDKTFNELINDEDYFIFQAAEAEVFSLIPSILNMLPEECAESFKLFLEGWKVSEIAEKLNKPATTIYSQRERAISTLRNKLSKNKLISIILLIYK